MLSSHYQGTLKLTFPHCLWLVSLSNRQLIIHKEKGIYVKGFETRDINVSQTIRLLLLDSQVTSSQVCLYIYAIKFSCLKSRKNFSHTLSKLAIYTQALFPYSTYGQVKIQDSGFVPILRYMYNVPGRADLYTQIHVYCSMQS